MAAFNSQWSFEGMTQPSLAEIIGQMAEIERKLAALMNRSVQNDYQQPQPSYPPNYFHPDWQDYPSYSWDKNQDQFYVPSLPYSPPQQPVQKSRMEEMKECLERMENDRKRQAAIMQKQIADRKRQEAMMQKQIDEEGTLQDRMIRLEQNTKIILDYLQSTSPGNAEMEPKEESEEQCKVDTVENGEVFHETVKVNRKRSRSDMEEECSFENKRSRIVKDEISDEDDRALDFNRIDKISPILISRQENLEEYIRIDLGESKIKVMDEIKFGGVFQSSKHAMEIKERTARRHDKTIFAIEPD